MSVGLYASGQGDSNMTDGQVGLGIIKANVLFTAVASFRAEPTI